ncbi:hypothetical protein EI94DRAFT_34216 [Lactarius quietus]|nr:hypothetical protein EI94DRAFT_34216 [Lactarius quietus]
MTNRARHSRNQNHVCWHRGSETRPTYTLFGAKLLTLRRTHYIMEFSCLQTYQFELDVVNIQDPGQENWRRKYVYWIPALHIDGKEVAKGRWDRRAVIQALDLWRERTISK